MKTRTVTMMDGVRLSVEIDSSRGTSYIESVEAFAGEDIWEILDPEIKKGIERFAHNLIADIKHGC